MVKKEDRSENSSQSQHDANSKSIASEISHEDIKALNEAFSKCDLLKIGDIGDESYKMPDDSQPPWENDISKRVTKK